MRLEERIKEGWDISAEGYSGFIQDELLGYQKEAWTRLILANTPREGKLKILDAGTGPGFFSIIMSLAAHHVIGVDVSKEMINCGKENALRAGVVPQFMVMDSQKTEFEDGSFDLVISRNLVWTLPKPEAAYQEWYRVLNKGGRLLVFDSDWLKECRDPGHKAAVEKDREEYEKLYGPRKVSYKDEEKARGWKEGLPLVEHSRPGWDLETLCSLGFRNVTSEVVSERVYDEKRLLLNRSNPMFMVRGDK